MERLRNELLAIDGRPYKAYKSLRGEYRFPDFTLAIDHVQGDPFAAPSRLSLRVPMPTAAVPESLWDTRPRYTACADFIGRAVADAIACHVKGRRGSGHSGEVAIARHGQQVLERNAVQLTPEWLEARITAGLPAAGRRVLGREAVQMLFEELPRVVAAAMLYANLPREPLQAHVDAVDDQQWLRRWLQSEGLVAFVADGARLPRRSGIDDRPLADGAVPFQAPESLAHTVTLPHAGAIRGMAIPAGVSLIVGGGFHGKSTLLHALERGVYDHIPGDGRERVVSLPSAVKIRAEDGRAVGAVDISPFIDNLPFGRDTRAFASDNASGSTSQATNIVEALAAGSRMLLLDEDTCATNFMIRDRRMQQLVAAEKEPITPFLHRVRELYERDGVSSVLVMGGSGDYFAVADTVVMLDNYAALDMTARARALAGEPPPPTRPATRPEAVAARRPRCPDLLPQRDDRPMKIAARGRAQLRYGPFDVDLDKLEQLVDPAQTEAIGWCIRRYAERCTEHPDLIAGLRALLEEIDAHGLDSVAPWKNGTLARPRLHELAGAINRMRGVRWGDER